MASGTPKKRTLKRASKSASKTVSQREANAKELRKIERLLGEDFDNVTQARKELARYQTKPTKKELKEFAQPTSSGRKKTSLVIEPVRRKIPNKKAYTIRELTKTERKTMAQYVLDIERDGPLFARDIKLEPGELFAVTFTGADGRLTRTKQMYTSIVKMMQVVGNYFTQVTGRPFADLISNIQIIKFKAGETQRETTTAWREKIMEVRAERKESKLAIKRDASKQRREARKVPRLKTKLEQEKEKNRELKRQLKESKKGKRK
jgi:hypothetical protein